LNPITFPVDHVIGACPVIEALAKKPAPLVNWLVLVHTPRDEEVIVTVPVAPLTDVAPIFWIDIKLVVVEIAIPDEALAFVNPEPPDGVDVVTTNPFESSAKNFPTVSDGSFIVPVAEIENWEDEFT